MFRVFVIVDYVFTILIAYIYKYNKPVDIKLTKSTKYKSVVLKKPKSKRKYVKLRKKNIKTLRNLQKSNDSKVSRILKRIK